MKIKYFQYGKGLKKICFVAGIHGVENTGIQIALELMKFLKNSNLNYKAGILPLVNIEGALKETRENPVDGKDINNSFLNKSSKIFGLFGNPPKAPNAVANAVKEGFAELKGADARCSIPKGTLTTMQDLMTDLNVNAKYCKGSLTNFQARLEQKLQLAIKSTS